MPTRHAACSCGQLTLVAHVDPVGVSLCHCLACQRRTGSTYGAQASFPKDQVETAGESTEYVRIGDEGNACHFRFCPRCGATVWYFFDEDFRVVPVGAFADPAFAAPTVSVYEERRHAWVSVPDGARHLW